MLRIDRGGWGTIRPTENHWRMRDHPLYRNHWRMGDHPPYPKSMELCYLRLH